MNSALNRRDMVCLRCEPKPQPECHGCSVVCFEPVSSNSEALEQPGAVLRVLSGMQFECNALAGRGGVLTTARACVRRGRVSGNPTRSDRSKAHGPNRAELHACVRSRVYSCSGERKPRARAFLARLSTISEHCRTGGWLLIRAVAALRAGGRRCSAPRDTALNAFLLRQNARAGAQKILRPLSRNGLDDKPRARVCECRPTLWRVGARTCMLPVDGHASTPKRASERTGTRTAPGR